VDLFVSATAMEGAFLEAWPGAPFEFHGRAGLRGQGWAWLELGVGKVNAAATLSAFLQAYPEVRRVLVFGLAGAYPGTGLRPGALVLASEEIQADLGTAFGMKPLGFPALRLEGTDYYNRFPADAAFTAELADRLGLLPMPLVTRDQVSESLEAAHAIRRQWGGVAENMEGAAVAQVALWHRRPWAELRAISNLAGVRKKSEWRIPESVAALRTAFERLRPEE